ncbi:sterol uptake control protein 2 [Fusarium langsethiae]|uniref:Sterol uptake control protein 2 n=1 Tax=Fusarium langsethiae TaxID=179993 RepID=A0A0N0DAX1_FUSLA|nr:sterol uptake control protein 2 [Fusarium langsethiae]
MLGEMGAGNMHYDAETACIMILVRSARLILLQSMLLYQTTLQMAEAEAEQEDEYSSYHAMWAQCVPVLECDVRKCVDDMLASVPYALGDIDSNGMPSSMMYDGAAAIMIAERAAIILTRLNSAIGIRSAVGWLAADVSEENITKGIVLDCPQVLLFFLDAGVMYVQYNYLV